MSFPRLSGILLHPISLPSRGGIGDFGPAAYEFVDFLAAARQGLWQVLPLGPPANGNSPYSSTSAFAGNPLLISLQRLAERGWLDSSLMTALAQNVGPIDYDAVRAQKLPLLSKASRRFLSSASSALRARYQKFCADNAWWLEDFVLYDALRDRYQQQLWSRWPAELTRRQPAALETARRELGEEIDLRRVMQF